MTEKKDYFMKTAIQINSLYLERMYQAENQSDSKTLSRIRDYWWPSFIKSYESDENYALDNLDVFMDQGREKFNLAAKNYALEQGFIEGSQEYIQRITQFMKSNTGKMFERFVGLVIAFHLFKIQSSYAIWKFTKELEDFSIDFSPKQFNVKIQQGKSSYNINIDADLLLFDPANPKDFVYMISVKSTLKDRFHNVPFWNLLRNLSLSNDTELAQRVFAKNLNRLEKCKYVAICSDLAKEQPDFIGENPRNLLSFDASLLDAAYVTSSKAINLKDSEQHFGFTRDYPFNRLSRFFSEFK